MGSSASAAVNVASSAPVVPALQTMQANRHAGVGATASQQLPSRGWKHEYSNSHARWSSSSSFHASSCHAALVGSSAAGAVLATALGTVAGLRRRGRATRRTRVSASAPAVAAKEAVARDVDFAKLRDDFPTLALDVRPGMPLIYLDSAATSHKPKRVLEELRRFYEQDNSNVHRGMHTLSIRATDAFEGARMKLAKFIGAADPVEVIFTRNATEAINLVAATWARANISKGDEIILTVMEHHSNLVPWQLLAQQTGATLKFVGVTPEGTMDTAEFETLLSERTKLVSLQHVSNVLGCINPVKWIAEKAHGVGAKVLIDACQSVPHMPVDVAELGVDWIVGSGHKMCGPTGIGFLWGRAELLRESPPFLGGGEMIDEVNLESSTYADIPHKFEAGTPAFAEAVALGAACDYLREIGMEAVHQHEEKLARHLYDKIKEIPNAVIYGPPPDAEGGRAALLSFNIEGCHPHDIATLADQEKGIAMRAGHHCCQPLHRHFGVTASARLSTYLYTTLEEIDEAVAAVKDAAELLSSIGEGSVAV